MMVVSQTEGQWQQGPPPELSIC